MIRYGRLAGSARTSKGNSPDPLIQALRESSEVVINNGGILPASTYEEVELIANYLEGEGIRIVEIDGEWSMPAFGAGGLWNRLADKTNNWQSFTQDD